MEQISAPSEIIEKTCLPHTIEKKPYQFSKYCIRLTCNEGELLYHTLTGELLLLSDRADGSLQENDCNELKRKRFLVPCDCDEYELSLELRNLAMLLSSNSDYIDHFTIFTSTDCNARCYYCYELGRTRINMRSAIAADTVEYIDKVRKGRSVKIRWFGGEPLVNIDAINIICKELEHRGIPFSTSMISNGFLFDKELVSKAKMEWNLESIQITLDGTEENYNSTKAYVRCNENAFRRVLKNIDLLLDKGIAVSVRLNMNLQNAADLYELANLLSERYKAKSKFNVYVHTLKDFGSDDRRHDDELECYKEAKKLKSHLSKLGIGKPDRLKKIKYNQCMADNDKCITVLPDGSIGKCEHESEDKLIGTLYSGTDNDAIEMWKQRINRDECRDCIFAPSCVKLLHCAWNNRGCTETERKIMMHDIESRILNEYLLYREGEYNDSGTSPDPVGGYDL